MSSVSCSLLINVENVTQTTKEIKDALENGPTETKIEYMKKIIGLHLNGESQASLLMVFIRFVLPNQDHTLKKLSLQFLEIVDKVDANGRQLPEMILICQFLRNDLQHPNEYVRGCVLRFVSRLKEEELVEPLAEPIISNLEHRHAYVRRAAVMAVFSLYQKFPKLMVDAPEIIERFLDGETDMTAKRNAFLMLFTCAQERAIRFLKKMMDDDVSQVGEGFQLVLVQFCNHLRIEVSQYLRVIFHLLASKSPAVLFQCASTLVAVSSAPTAIKEAATTFVHLLNTSSDTNVRLIVLDRLEDIYNKTPEILQDMLMDILRTLSAPNPDVRRKVVDLALRLVTAQNAEHVVQLLRKEIAKSQAGESTEADARTDVHLCRVCATKQPSLAPVVIGFLLEYVLEASSSAFDIITFVKETLTKHPALVPEILEKLCALLPQMTYSRVIRVVCWIFGVHCKTPEQCQAAFIAIKTLSETLSLFARKDTETYEPNTHVYDASVMCSTLVKLALTTPPLFKAVTDLVQHLLSLAEAPESQIDEDSHERILLCLRMLQNKSHPLVQSIVHTTYDALVKLEERPADVETAKEHTATTTTPVDSPIIFTQLIKSGKIGNSGLDTSGLVEGLMGQTQTKAKDLNRVTQLTGFADPIYCEATITVHQFDILLDLLVVNQTNAVMQNVTVELATVGDLKLCERPQVYTLAPHEQLNFKANIKVSSTETGIIFGNIIYDTHATASERCCVILNDVHIDIMDYIKPADCSSTLFRQMWVEFEWENKVIVNTDITDLRQYVEHVVKTTNMKCLTPESSLEGDCDFLSANLYAKSTFGEDALANISIEKNGDRLEGFVRIRAKTQGIALSLGDKITIRQRATKL